MPLVEDLSTDLTALASSTFAGMQMTLTLLQQAHRAGAALLAVSTVFSFGDLVSRVRPER